MPNTEAAHKTAINVQISRAIWERVVSQCEARTVGRQRIVEAALREWLDRHETEELP